MKYSKMIRNAEMNEQLVIIIPFDCGIPHDSIRQPLQKFMKEYEYQKVLILLEEMIDDSQFKCLEKIEIIKLNNKNMKKLLVSLSKKVDAMGDLIYKNTYVVDINFTRNKGLYQIIEHNMLEIESLVWSRIFHSNN